MKDLDEFWKLTARPSAADARMAGVPVVLVPRETLHVILESVREAVGPSAREFLHHVGLEAGHAAVETIVAWTGSRSPVEIVDDLGDIHARLGWFAVESMEMDPASHQARFRMVRTVETHGIEGRWATPGCHFLRGYLAGFFRALFWDDSVDGTETSCRGKGDKACEFVLGPSDPGPADG